MKGINSKRKRLADGGFKTYYWAWKGGPALRGQPGTPEFIASYNEAVARKVTPPRGSLLTPFAAISGIRGFHRAGRPPSPTGAHAVSSCRIKRGFKRRADLDLDAPAGLDCRRRIGVARQDRHQVRTSAGRLCVDGAGSRTLVGLQSRAGRRQPMRARRAAVSRLSR